jgi:hypothetical protein
MQREMSRKTASTGRRGRKEGSFDFLGANLDLEPGKGAASKTYDPFGITVSNGLIPEIFQPSRAPEVLLIGKRNDSCTDRRTGWHYSDPARHTPTVMKKEGNQPVHSVTNYLCSKDDVYSTRQSLPTHKLIFLTRLMATKKRGVSHSFKIKPATIRGVSFNEHCPATLDNILQSWALPLYSRHTRDLDKSRKSCDGGEKSQIFVLFTV